MRPKILYPTVLIILLMACKSEPKPNNTYEVNVKATGVYDGIRAYLSLSEGLGSNVITDSAVVFNEVFTFKGKIDGANMRTLTIDGINGQTAFVLEPGIHHVEIYKDSMYQSTVVGTHNNDILNAFKKDYKNMTSKVAEVRKEFYDAQRDNDQNKVQEIRKRGDSIFLELKALEFDFIDKHPNSDFSLILLEGVAKQKSFDVVKVKNALEKLQPLSQKNQSNYLKYQSIRIQVELNESKPTLAIGKQVPDFSASDPEGNTVNLTSILGKVTIIDFWASWCKPCRVDNPKLVKIYEDYHNKGLEIISVSLDRSNQKQRWVDAIKTDQLNWYNVSNLKFWNDPIAKLYDVNSIPATFIVDEQGHLIASRLRGNSLRAKISELLD